MNYFSKNMKTLSLLYSQKEIAQKTNMSTASVTNYVSGASEPSAYFLIELKKNFHISIDDFLTKELSAQVLLKENASNYEKFIGSYIVYYYNSSAYKGKVGSYNYDILTYGVVSVYNSTTSPCGDGINAQAMFMLKREDAENALKELNSFNGDTKKIEEFYKGKEKTYQGSLEQNATQFFINLSNNNDRCLIILNNPPSPKHYLGGLGTVNSISRGREHIPCVQYIILSSKILQISDGEIFNLLSLGFVELSIKNETTNLIELFKNLYIEQTNSTLTEYQKRNIIEDTLENIISDVAEANMFRFAKVSNMEDDNYYRLIKETSDEQ